MMIVNIIYTFFAISYIIVILYCVAVLAKKKVRKHRIRSVRNSFKLVKGEKDD